jgi:SRSO17 transposase
LPQNWAEDRKRRRKAGVPEEISFKTKPEIALEHLRGTCEAGAVCGVVLTDAGASAETHLCTSIATLGSSYVVPRATEHHDLAVGHGSVAVPKMVELRPTTEADAPPRQSKACGHLHAAMVSGKTVAAQEFVTQ